MEDHDGIEDTVDWSFENLFGLTPEEAQKGIRLYRERYDVKGWAENDPVEGALEALERLEKAGYRMTLATSKPMHYAMKIIEKFEFSKYVVSEYEPLRPGYEPKKTEVIKKGIKLLGARKSECLMVGDRMYDILGAREVGIDVAILDVGYAQPGEFEKSPPDYYFKDFQTFVQEMI